MSMSGSLVILNFHGIGIPTRPLTPGEQQVWIHESLFNSVLDRVCRLPSFELTFDDANESDFTVALPALQARGLKARFFVLAGRIGQPGFLSASQLEGLCAAGMTIGTHGMHHRPWAKLDRGELHEELIVARDRLRKMTGSTVDEASCPFGSYNRRVLRSLRGAGYRTVYTSDGVPACSGDWLLPRRSICHGDNAEILLADLSRPLSGPRRIWRQSKLLLKRWQ
jgi:peptidoglycan/xylan/chitin deacetylase (PgdA/CDA1 family)